MRRLLPPLVLAAALHGAAAPAASAEVPDEPHALVGQVLAAYGGRVALARVHAYRLEGTMFSALRHDAVPVVRVLARPDRFKTLIDYGSAPEARLVDGARGWRAEGGGALEPAHGPMLGAMRLQAARADVPWILAERESVVVACGTRVRDGVVLHGLQLALGDGLVLRLWVHPRTHLVVVSEGALESGPMRTTFETDYADFRTVQGVRFAFHEDNWASGVQTGVTTVTRVVLDPRLAPDEFRPPPPPQLGGQD